MGRKLRRSLCKLLKNINLLTLKQMENSRPNPLAVWTNKAKEVLLNRTIVGVRYLNDAEMEDMGWYSRPLAIFLDNGEHLIISSDDEGNDGGALFYGTNGVLPTL